jgi:hypothetical protein
MILKYLTLFSFVTFLFLDYLIKNNYLGQSIKKYYFRFIGLSYLSIVFILSCIFFIIFMLFSYFDVNLFCFGNSLFDSDLFNFMSDSKNNSGSDKSINANGNLNINHPNFNLSVPSSSLNNLAAAVSVSGGGALALKVAQQVPGDSGAKVLAGGAA